VRNTKTGEYLSKFSLNKERALIPILFGKAAFTEGRTGSQFHA